MPTLPGGARVKKFLADSTITDDTAQMAWDTALGLLDGYTRGNHINRQGVLRPDLVPVCLTIAARIAANPHQVMVRDAAGSFNRTRGVGFQGMTLTEQIILNRYRKRALG